VLLGLTGATVALFAYLFFRSANPFLAPVEGIVVVGGKPGKLAQCTYGRIWLHPDRVKGNHTPFVPVGELGRDGKYRVFTDGHPGAPPGWYRVVVLAIEQRDRAESKKATQTLLVDRQYTEADTTNLVLEVTPVSSPGAYDLNLR